MKRIFSKEKSRKEKKADFYILYTIVFAAISLFIYMLFLFLMENPIDLES